MSMAMVASAKPSNSESRGGPWLLTIVLQLLSIMSVPKEIFGMAAAWSIGHIGQEITFTIKKLFIFFLAFTNQNLSIYYVAKNCKENLFDYDDLFINRIKTCITDVQGPIQANKAQL